MITLRFALAQERLDVGSEVDRDRLGEHAAAAHADAEPLNLHRYAVVTICSR